MVVKRAAAVDGAEIDVIVQQERLNTMAALSVMPPVRKPPLVPPLPYCRMPWLTTFQDRHRRLASQDQGARPDLLETAHPVDFGDDAGLGGRAGQHLELGAVVEQGDGGLVDGTCGIIDHGGPPPRLERGKPKRGDPPR